MPVVRVERGWFPTQITINGRRMGDKSGSGGLPCSRLLRVFRGRGRCSECGRTDHSSGELVGAFCAGAALVLAVIGAAATASRPTWVVTARRVC